MQLEQLELTGGGTLTLYLRESVEAMPHFRQRPLVLVVPGGGYTHVSPRESDPVALQFAAAGYHTAVLHYAVGESARDALPMRQLALCGSTQNSGIFCRIRSLCAAFLPAGIWHCPVRCGRSPAWQTSRGPMPCCWHTRWSPPENTPTGTALCS